MIISHKHKFIFIKTRKTAGTSIEISLSRFCCNNDIVTPISLNDEPLRGVLGLKPQNYLFSSFSQQNGSQSIFFKKILLKTISYIELKYPIIVPYRIKVKSHNYISAKCLYNIGFYNHMPLSKVVRKLGHEILNSYFIFCFEREPIKKVVSDYNYRASNKSIDEYLNTYPLPSDYDKYTLHNRIAVDFVGSFETLCSDLEHACSRIGISFDGWLPRAKKAKDSKISCKDLNERQTKYIREYFSNEYYMLKFK